MGKNLNSIAVSKPPDGGSPSARVGEPGIRGEINMETSDRKHTGLNKFSSHKFEGKDVELSAHFILLGGKPHSSRQEQSERVECGL